MIRMTRMIRTTRPSRSTRRALPTARLFAVLALGAACGLTAHAHEDMPQGWCTNPEQPEPQIIGQFAFSPIQLAAFKNQVLNQAQQQQVCPKTILGIEVPPIRGDSCGIVDDWHYANRLANRTCRNLTPDQPEGDMALHFVSAPADFNSSESHHSLYRFADGTLTGHCVVCGSGTGYSGEPGGD